MVVEVVERDPQGRVAELVASLESEGGALVVLKRGAGSPTIARIYLPDDADRQIRCRQLLDRWRNRAPDLVADGYAWPVGHPRHQFVPTQRDIRRALLGSLPDAPGTARGDVPAQVTPRADVNDGTRDDMQKE